MLTVVTVAVMLTVVIVALVFTVMELFLKNISRITCLSVEADVHCTC